MLAFYVSAAAVRAGWFTSWVLAGLVFGVALVIDRALTEKWRRLYRAFLVACGLATAAYIIVVWPPCSDWVPDWLCYAVLEARVP